MAERLSTTLEKADGTPFAPTVDPMFQITWEAGSNAVVSFYGRQASTLPWALLAQVEPSQREWLRLAQVKVMMVSVTGNTAGKSVKVTDGE